MVLEVSGSPRMYRWFRHSENPLVRFLPLIIFVPLVAIIVIIPIMFMGMSNVFFFIGPVLAMVVVMHIIAYLITKRRLEKVPDNLTRLFPLSLEEASQRLEGAMTEAGIKFMRYSTEEYREMGLIDGLARIGYNSQGLTWIYQLDATRAMVLRDVPYPEGHCSLTLFPYEEEGIYLMDKVKEAADRALGP